MFSELSPRQIAAVLENATVQNHGAAGLLFNQGDPTNRFFVLLEGMVTLSIYREDGTQALVETIEPGHTFAEAAAFLFGTYPVTAEFTAGSEVVSIAFNDLMEKMVSVDGLALAILGSLARWEQELARQLDALKLHSPTKRLCRELLDQAGEPDGAGSTTVTLPYDKGHLAKRLGVTAESLSRILARLANAGIRSEGRSFVIADVQAIRAYCRDPAKRDVG